MLPDCHIEGVTRLPDVGSYKSQLFAVTKARCLWLQKPDVCGYKSKSQKQDVCGCKAIKYNKMQMTFVVMEAFEGVHDTEVIVHME